MRALWGVGGTMRTWFAILVVLGFLFGSAGAFGQSNYAVLSGTVVDPQGGVLAGATVQLSSRATRAERGVTTDAQGFFQITGLLPGSAPSFSTRSTA